LFFVPGGEPRKLEKCRGVQADTVMLDLEDSVSLHDKARARDLVAGALREGGFVGPEVGVRINPPGTPFFEDDLDAVVRAGADAIMLPKSQSAGVIAAVAERIDALERQRSAETDRYVHLLALIETAVGVVHAQSVVEATTRLSAICFGHADFSRDMGIRAADSSQGVILHARCRLAITAKAAGVTPIDTVFVDVRDEAAFRRDAELGMGLGFEGKLCIHPAQVVIANEVYTPTSEQLDYARRVVEAAENAEAEGKGVFTVDGKMVDAPLVEVQQQLLDKARCIGIVDD
jgi:citrate lyase subunit beta/citryl-CoA lyase